MMTIWVEGRVDSKSHFAPSTSDGEATKSPTVVGSSTDREVEEQLDHLPICEHPALSRSRRELLHTHQRKPDQVERLAQLGAQVLWAGRQLLTTTASLRPPDDHSTRVKWRLHARGGSCQVSRRPHSIVSLSAHNIPQMHLHETTAFVLIYLTSRRQKKNGAPADITKQQDTTVQHIACLS